MKQGLKSIESLYGELMRQREMRKDLIADTRSLTANTEKENYNHCKYRNRPFRLSSNRNCSPPNCRTFEYSV